MCIVSICRGGRGLSTGSDLTGLGEGDVDGRWLDATEAEPVRDLCLGRISVPAEDSWESDCCDKALCEVVSVSRKDRICSARCARSSRVRPMF